MSVFPLTTKRVVLAVMLLAGVFVSSRSQTSDLKTLYTKDHPLVYEDAWDLWPYVFLDDEGQPTGYNVDLVKMVMEKLDLPYRIELKPTVQALEDLRDGRSDLMLGMVADFHDDYTTHYGKNVVQLFTHSVAYPRDEYLRVHNLEDLARQEVIVHEGSFSHHLMINRGWGGNAQPYGDMDKAIRLVSAEGHGQVLWNTMSLKWLIHKYHTDNLELAPVDIPSGDYRFMSNNEELLRAVDEAFSELKAAELLQPIEQRWFYPEEKKNEGMPRWLWLVAAGIGFVTLALVAATLIYKLRERKVTLLARSRNARLALILKTCRVKIWTYDIRKNSFVWYGHSTQETRTYSYSEFMKRYSTDDAQRLGDALRLLASKKETEVRMEMDIMDDGSGENRCYMVTMSVMRSSKDQPTVIIGTKNDITGEREEQRQVTDMMQRYKAVFNTAMVDMVAYDADGYIYSMNERAQQTFRMPIEAVLRERVKLSDIMPSEDFDIKDFSHTDFFYATLFIDYAKEKQLDSRKRRGEIIYEFQLVPVYNSNHQLTGAYGTGRETSEMVATYRQAQQNVKQLRATLQEVATHVENINYALQVGGLRLVNYSPQNHMLTINHRLNEAQYEFTQQRCIEMTDPSHVSRVMRLFRTMDRLNNVPLDSDVMTNLRLPGGQRLWLQFNLFPVYGPDGVIDHYSGICRDTSNIKHTEMLMQQESEKAQEVEQVKNKFLHNMCYEIRTPLNIVVGYAEMFQTEHSHQEEDVFIKEIKDNSAYLLNLINDILFLSRLDARMVEINIQPCDFAQTFESHCYQGWSNWQREGVKYVAENQYDKLVVNIDDANFGRIIQQIVTNAAQHTTHGTVKAHYEYMGGRLIVAIEDTGTGIAPEMMEHLFERFNNSSGNNKGTGLGMPICKELITQLGGTIDLNSEVDKGTTVWVTLPCEAIAIEHKKEV